MVNYDIIKRMKASDGKFVQRALQYDDDELNGSDLIADRNTFQAALDNPRLYDLILRAPLGIRISPAMFFYVIVRRTLKKHDIHSYRMAEYVSSVLEQFGFKNRYTRISKYDDEQFDSLVDISSKISNSSGERAFLMSSYMGDYSLWLSGIYPECIEYKGLSIRYYDTMGRRGYLIAAVNPVAKINGTDKLFEDIVDNYSIVRKSLNSLRETLLFSR